MSTDDFEVIIEAFVAKRRLLLSVVKVLRLSIFDVNFSNSEFTLKAWIDNHKLIFLMFQRR